MNIIDDGRVEESKADIGSDIDAPTSGKPWVYLSDFKVTCKGRDKVLAPIYANGRQQLPLEILIEARDENGVVVRIPEDDLVIWIVDYNSSGDLPSGVTWTKIEEPKYVYDWATQLDGVGGEGSNSTQPLLSEAAQQSSEPSSGSQVFRRWMISHEVKAVKIAVKVTSPGGVEFISNNENPAPGKFDSYVIVDGREPDVITWDKLAITGPRNVYTDYPFDVDLYYVYFNDPLNPGLKIVDAINYRAALDTCHYAWMKGARRFEQAAFKMLPARTLTYKSCHHSCSFRLGEREGEAEVGRIRNNLGAPCGNYSYQHGLVGYINQYGNETRVVLRAASDGNTLGLDSPRRLEEGSEAPPVDDQ